MLLFHLHRNCAPPPSKQKRTSVTRSFQTIEPSTKTSLLEKNEKKNQLVKTWHAPLAAHYVDKSSGLSRICVHSNRPENVAFVYALTCWAVAEGLFFLPYLLCTGSIWQKIEKRQHRLLMDDVQTKARHDWRDDDKFVRPRFGRTAIYYYDWTKNQENKLFKKRASGLWGLAVRLLL